MSQIKDEKTDIITTDDMEQDDKINIEEVFVNMASVKEEPPEDTSEEMGEVDQCKIELKHENIFEAHSDNKDGENLIEKLDEVIVKLEEIKRDSPSLIKTIKHFDCNNCGEDYERFCLKCSSLTHILNNIVPDLDSNSYLNTTPRNILDISDISKNRVFALKTLPQNVTFGPFEGLSAIESTNGNRWKIKDSKFINDENANWMKYVISTANRFSSNLDIFQFDGSLYFETNREIQEGEELLICLGEEVKSDEEECYFVPVKKEEFSKIFACTLCCLGFRLENCLMEHKSKCPHMEDKEDIEDFEVIECHCCKVWLEKQEHLESHMQYCLEHFNKMHNISSYLQRSNGNEVGAFYEQIEASTSNNGDDSSPDIANIKSYRCHICEERFSERCTLKAHLTENHSEIIEKNIKSCGSSRQIDYENLSIPLNTHNDVKHFECDICKMKFSKRFQVDIHIKNIHLVSTEKDYKCPECPYQTNYKFDLRRHVHIHSDVKPFRCDFCRMAFWQKCRLKEHMNNKHSKNKEKNYKCPKCPFETTYNSSLKIHLNTHSEASEKKYKCTQCFYRTNYKGNLKVHLNTHKDVKPFACGICTKTFSKELQLIIHMKTKHLENAEKDYKCPKCPYETNYKNELNKHLDRHNYVKPYECHICKKVFCQKSNLKTHINVIHSDKTEKNYKCPQCPYESNYESSLKAHLYKHSDTKEKFFKCSECPFQTNYRKSLKKHRKTHNNIKSWGCEFCEKEFRRKANLQRHLNDRHSDKKEKDYKCTECSFQTNYKHHLSKHRRSHSGRS